MHSPLSRRPAFLRHVRFAPGAFLRNVLSGGIVGLMSVAISVSLGALVFSGSLSAYGANGISLALISSAVVGLAVALFGSLPGTVADAQDAPAAILAVAAAGIVAALPPGEEAGAAFVTVVATIGLTTLLTGALLLAVGSLRLGRLVRYLPYPVVGGFLAGTGWLLVVGGMSVLTDVHFGPSELLGLFAMEAVPRWLPGVAYALVILAVTARVGHFLVWPLLLVGGVGAFYLALGLSGGSVSGWREAGLLLGSYPDVDLLRPLAGADLRLVHWPLVFSHGATAVSVAFLTLMSVLFNGSALELATARKVDLDRELRIPGVANLLIGPFGGMVGFQILSFTVLNHKVGTGSRVAGLMAVAMVGATLLFGASLISYIPTMIIGGLVLFLGAEFLKEWLYDAFFKLPRLEYAIIVCILLVIATVGFIPGVAVGLVMAVVLFVVNYSRTEAVAHALTGSHVQSRVARDPHERRHLRAHADELLVLRLQGFLFFGTAHGLQERVEERLASSPAPRWVLLDFTRVSGLDATALASFAVLLELAKSQGFTLVLCAVSPAIDRQLHQSGVQPGEHGAVETFGTLDEGLEWCEARILAGMATDRDPQLAFEAKMDALMHAGTTFADVLPYLETIELPTGHVLMRQGDPPDVLFFVASGQVTARLESPGRAPVRLETMRCGSLVGELGFYTGGVRTASVVADEPSTVHRLTRDALERMAQQDPQRTAALHELVVRMLAHRVGHLMTVVQALQP